MAQIKKDTSLRKAILQAAIIGELTSNSPQDFASQKSQDDFSCETGKQLLGRIIEKRNAKARDEWEEALKQNPKAKKPAVIIASEIEEEDIPFEIPESWCWCRLEDICTKLVDGDHNPPAGLPTNTEYIMASSQNINDDSLVELEKVRYLSKELFEVENERTKAQKGDIFFTSVGTLGRSCVYDGSKNICFQRSVSVIKTEIYNKFFKYCLDAPFIQYFIIDNATGTAQKGFYLNQLAKLVIPLPPLEEQEVIVKKVEELLPLCK
ncbi:MAG: restriction endonuclease subunit S [Treponema sp.]|nr:restriction endonuclease subunit S [Treponema sp.]